MTVRTGLLIMIYLQRQNRTVKQRLRTSAEDDNRSAMSKMISTGMVFRGLKELHLQRLVAELKKDFRRYMRRSDFCTLLRVSATAVWQEFQGIQDQERYQVRFLSWSDIQSTLGCIPIKVTQFFLVRFITWIE